MGKKMPKNVLEDPAKYVRNVQNYSKQKVANYANNRSRKQAKTQAFLMTLFAVFGQQAKRH
jgi:hypothetical protein